jgi:hypothetical protein
MQGYVLSCSRIQIHHGRGDRDLRRSREDRVSLIGHLCGEPIAIDRPAVLQYRIRRTAERALHDLFIGNSPRRLCKRGTGQNALRDKQRFALEINNYIGYAPVGSIHRMRPLKLRAI